MRAALAVVVLVLTACGSLGGAAGPTAPATSSPTPSPGGIVAVVPWRGVAASPRPGRTISVPPAGIAPCGPTDLRFRFDGWLRSLPGWRASESLRTAAIAVAAPERACWLPYNTTVAFLDSAGRTLPTVMPTVTYDAGSGPQYLPYWRVGATLAAPDRRDDPGDVHLELAWDNWCRPDVPAALRVALPNGARADVALTSNDGPAGCVDRATASTLLGYFAASSAPPSVPPWVAPITFDVSTAAPLAVRPGETLRYTIVLRSEAATSVGIVPPCPVFSQRILASTNVESRWILPCEGLPSIPPGGAVAFDMEVAVPASAGKGATLFWAIESPSRYSAVNKFLLTLLGP